MQRTPRTLLTALVAAGLLGTAFAGSATAAGGRDEAPGQLRKAGAAAFTEDTDTNDGGTPEDVADEGDNKHPSGKDRSVEGSSGTQGSSTSDPDDDGRGPDRSNGGPDKPGGSGGVDLADQDGNNGCGNDDDFEDDNNGNCGGPDREKVSARSAQAQQPAAPASVSGPLTTPAVAGTETAPAPAESPAAAPPPFGVLGVQIEAAAPEALGSPVAPAEVLGAQQTRSPEALARTGLGAAAVLVLVAVGLLVLGFAARRFADR